MSLFKHPIRLVQAMAPSFCLSLVLSVGSTIQTVGWTMCWCPGAMTVSIYTADTVPSDLNTRRILLTYLVLFQSITTESSSSTCTISEDVREWMTECVCKSPKLLLHLFPPFPPGSLYDPLPFLLPLAFPWRLHAPVQWQRPTHAALGQRVQVGLSYLHTCSLNGLFPMSLIWPSFCALCSKFDLYTKSTDLPDVENLKPYYQSLINKYCPGVLWW